LRNVRVFGISYFTPKAWLQSSSDSGKQTIQYIPPQSPFAQERASLSARASARSRASAWASAKRTHCWKRLSSRAACIVRLYSICINADDDEDDDGDDDDDDDDDDNDDENGDDGGDGGDGDDGDDEWDDGCAPPAVNTICKNKRRAVR